MKITRKYLHVLLIVLLMVSIVGCSPKIENVKNEPVEVKAKVEEEVKIEEKAKVAIDAIGREVNIPENIEKIAVTCYGGTTHEMVVLGARNKIVAQPSMEKFQQIFKMYPAFADIINPGSFDEVNVEELFKVAPDMAFVGISSKKGNKQIEDAGIPTFTMLIGTGEIDTIKKEFVEVGKVLGEEERAKALVEYWDEKISMVEELVKQVPEDKRKKVYYTGETITNANTGKWGNSFILVAGGINSSEALTTGAKEVSVEEVLAWNPDVIITQKRPSGLNDILEDKRIQELTAIKNKEVYPCPIGAFWWDRPSPEAPLAFMWLAKELYPEYTEIIDLEKEVKYFYKNFYEYELTDEEYQSFF